MSNLPDFKIGEESKLVLKDILQSKDKDNKGYVDVDELGDCLEAFGFDPDDEDLDFLKIHMDDNGDGRLEVQEVLDNIEVINYHCWYGKILMDEFLYIDADKDGVIRFPEMLRVLTNRGGLEVVDARRLLDALARKFDANFDGKFSYPEFVKIYMSDLLPFKDEIESGVFKPTPKPESTPKTPKKKKIIKKKPSESALLDSPNSSANLHHRSGNMNSKKNGSTTSTGLKSAGRVHHVPTAAGAGQHGSASPAAPHRQKTASRPKTGGSSNYPKSASTSRSKAAGVAHKT